MSRVNQFGLWADGYRVERAVADTLMKWLPSTAAEVERGYSLPPGTIKIPLYWSFENVFSKDMENALPAGIVITPGLNSEPRREGTGAWCAEWRVGVAVIDGADDYEWTARLVKLHGTAVRLAIMQNRGLVGLGDRVVNIKWLNEQYDDIPSSLDDRNIGSAQIVFAVELRDTLDERSGPSEPTVDPRLPPRDSDPGPWPVAETVDVDLTKES